MAKNVKKKNTSGKKKKKTGRKKKPSGFSLKKFLLWSLFSLIVAFLLVLIPNIVDRASISEHVDLKHAKQIKPDKTPAQIEKPVVKKPVKRPPEDEFDYFKSSLVINGSIRRFINTNKIGRSNVDEIFEEKKSGGRRFLYTTFNIRLPEEMDLERSSEKMISIITDKGGIIEDSYTYHIGKRNIVTFYVSAYDQVTHFFSIEKGAQPALHDGHSPVIAIIIDDCGYLPPKYFTYLEGYENMDLAILPHTPYASHMARFAEENSNEVMLHLPMEPKSSSQATDKGMIFTTFTDAQLSDTFLDNLTFVPTAVGFNNHKGSKVTSDQQTMELLMAEASKRDLFFVDSRTTSSSIAYETAKKMGIPTIKRDVFLDNEASETYIIGQFHNLFKIAYLKGYSVGICHMRKATIKTFGKVFDEIKALNIRVVPVSYIIENRDKLAKNGQKKLPENLEKMLKNIEED